LLEKEHFWQNFGRMNGRDIDLTVLRFANIVGPTANTPMTRLLSEPKAPVLLGFNPVMQFIHEADVVAALAHAVLEDSPGTFNIAGSGTLPLVKAMALAKKPPLALPATWLRWGASLLDGQLGQLAPFDFDYLRYRWVADTSKMTEILGFYPQYSGEEAVRAFASGKDQQQWQSVLDQAMAQGEELRQFVDQYRRQLEKEEMG
jgi:UDP-glucose 4-epimerase